MTCKITKGVKISIQTSLQRSYELDLNIFSYKVIIENKSENPIKLIKRHWIIKDTANFDHEVIGDGVLGKQPKINPYESYVYTSRAKLNSTIGSMKGKFLFKRIDNGKLFYVEIPQFNLIAPHILN